MEVLPPTSEMVSKEDVPIPGSTPFGILEMVDRIRNKERLTFLRYFDGEFHSMFNTAKRGRSNADGHNWMSETMGMDLRVAFEQAIANSGYAPVGGASTAGIRIELAPCWTEWLALRQYVLQLSWNKQTILHCGRTWVDAVKSGEVFSFLDAVVQSGLPVVMIGKSEISDLANALGSRLVIAPYPNAYKAIDVIVENMALPDMCIVLSSIGMASGPLLWRLPRRHILIDWGHVPDALCGIATRNYLRQGWAEKTHERFVEWSRGGVV